MIDLPFPPTIVFDLDGTLVDTAPDLLATLNAILASEGMLPVVHDAMLGMIGSGARVMIESAFATGGRALTPGQLDGLVGDFLTIYDAHLVDASRPYPGVEVALDRFAAEGWRLAVCTNKREAPAKKLLRLLGLVGRFAAIAGQDTFGVSKPDPRHLTKTIRAAGGNPAFAVMVGDSFIDVDTANAAGIPVVAVSFGYSPAAVTELGATRVIDRFDQLYDTVAGLRGGPVVGSGA